MASAAGAPSGVEIGATKPDSCQRLPSKYSLTSKWVENVSKFTGAHSQKNWGSATGAPVGPAFTDRTDPPRAITTAQGFTRCEIGELSVDLDPALPTAELGQSGVVEHHPRPDALMEVRLLDRGGSANEGEIGTQPVLRGLDHDAERVERLQHLDARTARPRWPPPVPPVPVGMRGR